MARISGDNIIFDLVLFLMLAIPFGIATNAINVNATVNTIFGPWPTFEGTAAAFTGPAKSCGFLDFGCQASAGIAQATAFVGAVLAFPGLLAGSALARISAFGNLGTLVLFGSSTSLNAIPGANFFILALIIIVTFELFRMFRGSSVGA